MGEKGGDCRREGANYSLWCEECGSGVALYKGETGRNGYTRGLEHLRSLQAKNEDKSVLWSHSVHHHESRTNVTYRMRVTGTYPEPLDRQCQEKVEITNFRGDVLMNRKNELGE